jgi:beta-carotene 3-hydroxylase
MEFMAWFTHKFVMHGLLWYLHRDHHQGHEGFFEKNDAFFLIFAVPSAYCYMTGLMNHDFRLYIGIGISLYGLAYFLVHDIIIHQRFKLFRNWNNKYILGIRRAHKIHHKHFNKEDGENFGMLIVPLRYFNVKDNNTLPK